MLQATKDNYWKAKAAELKLQNENEIRLQREQEEAEAGWKRRLNESDWIMKGVKKVEDKNVNVVIEEGLRRKEDAKYQHIKINIKSSGNVTADDIHNKKKKGDSGDPVDAPGPNGGRGRLNFVSRLGNIIFRSKEKESKANILKQQKLDRIKREFEANERTEFLVKNSHHIRVLQRVYRNLVKGRFPAHDETVENIVDYPKRSKRELAEENLQREKELTTYEVVPLQPTVEAERRRTNEEVLAEDYERRKWKVAGRLHQYRGEGKIYPIKSLKSTHAPLSDPAKNGGKPDFPETKLMPNEAQIKHKQDKLAKRRAKENVPIVSIRPSALNMSRIAVHVDEGEIIPGTCGGSDGLNMGSSVTYNASQLRTKGAYGSTDDIGTTASSLLYRDALAEEVNAPHFQSHSTAGMLTQRPSTANDSLVHSRKGWDTNKKSKLFNWKHKEVHDANSVHDGPHGEVIFDTPINGDSTAMDHKHSKHHLRDSEGMSIASTITQSTGHQFFKDKKYHLLRGIIVDPEYQENKGESSSSNSVRVASRRAFGYGNAQDREVVMQDMTGYYGGGGLLGAGDGGVYGVVDDESIADSHRAVRSYCKQDQSIGSRVLVEVHMARHRHLRKLDKFRLKKDMGFISRSQKDKKLKIKQEYLEEKKKKKKDAQREKTAL